MQDNLLSLKHQGCTCNRREILSVHSDLADRCTLVGQKVKPVSDFLDVGFVLVMDLVQHIETVLPELKICISVALVSVTKEHASYGEITESKAGQGALLLNILQK
ncbi:hypothetical protein SASPL_153013 [Salvia splendens]|uniref:Uncharacterized protein n=1 Tax=Salvia splendens TaxID=180675 RepID=A0A8X8W4S6_SALSN|nr:hypothetical protein SASPL_153013 [Salvia splendens]